MPPKALAFPLRPALKVFRCDPSAECHRVSARSGALSCGARAVGSRHGAAPAIARIRRHPPAYDAGDAAHTPPRWARGSLQSRYAGFPGRAIATTAARSEEHTSELQSLMRISYA